MRVNPVGERISGNASGRPNSSVLVSIRLTSREHARPELDPSERADVASHRAFVLGATVDVIEDTTREPPAGDRTEVVDGRDTAETALHTIELDRLEPDH